MVLIGEGGRRSHKKLYFPEPNKSGGND
jgi:hypothetical protein